MLGEGQWSNAADDFAALDGRLTSGAALPCCHIFRSVRDVSAGAWMAERVEKSISLPRVLLGGPEFAETTWL